MNQDSYLAGFKKAVISPYHFHKHFWVKFQNTVIMDPIQASKDSINKRNKKHVRYLDFIISEVPAFFHEVYHHMTNKVGLSESTENKCKFTIQYAKSEYPTCPIQS